jgi:hypothetical protein
LRGGISYGNSFIDLVKVRVIGPAYIKAYKLEENHAKWPRVILDPALIQYHDFQFADKFIDEVNENPVNNEISDEHWD